jgi:translation initiation factor IF-1
VHAGKFITDSSTGSERRSRLCEKKKKKMKISPGAPDNFLKI